MAKQKNDVKLETLLSRKILSRDVGSILSKLFRKIMEETGAINQATALMDPYLINSGKEKSAAKTSISAEFMSWKGFIDLLTNYLKIRKIVFSVKLDHGIDKKTNEPIITVHEITVRANGAKDQDIEK